jgi:hypothetical protein
MTPCIRVQNLGKNCSPTSWWRNRFFRNLIFCLSTYKVSHSRRLVTFFYASQKLVSRFGNCKRVTQKSLKFLYLSLVFSTLFWHSLGCWYKNDGSRLPFYHLEHILTLALLQSLLIHIYSWLISSKTERLPACSLERGLLWISSVP